MIKNIYKRRDGRFEGRITLGYQDGKRQYKAFFGADEETVAAKGLNSEQKRYCTAALIGGYDEFLQKGIKQYVATLDNRYKVC